MLGRKDLRRIGNGETTRCFHEARISPCKIVGLATRNEARCKRKCSSERKKISLKNLGRETIVLRIVLATLISFFHLLLTTILDFIIDRSIEKSSPRSFSQVQHYILVVQATDGGIPALSSTVTVYCNVVDLNDNAPIFEAGPHAVDIVENTTIGTPILSVTAQDLDSGDNGRVIYAVAGGDENGDFGVAPNGTLFTRKLLDREQKPLYNLVLSATDSPPPPGLPLSSTVQVCSFPL